MDDKVTVYKMKLTFPTYLTATLRIGPKYPKVSLLPPIKGGSIVERARRTRE